MALLKPITMPNGQVVTYHRLHSCLIIWPDEVIPEDPIPPDMRDPLAASQFRRRYPVPEVKVKATINSYVDQAAREAFMAPTPTELVLTGLPREPNPTEIYNAVAAHPMFAGAEAV